MPTADGALSPSAGSDGWPGRVRNAAAATIARGIKDGVGVTAEVAVVVASDQPAVSGGTSRR